MPPGTRTFGASPVLRDLVVTRSTYDLLARTARSPAATICGRESIEVACARVLEHTGRGWIGGDLAAHRAREPDGSALDRSAPRRRHARDARRREARDAALVRRAQERDDRDGVAVLVPRYRARRAAQ